MKVTTLRGYQEQDLGRIRARYAAGSRAVLYVLPTGGGKTVVFSFAARGAAQRMRRVCVLVHRETLLLQASSSLGDCGVPHGLIAPGHHETADLVQVASVQTLVRRLDRQRFDLLVVDEAHHSTAGSWQKILAANPTAHVLGVTATPVRTDGRGLDDIFEDLVIGPGIKDLISAGYLVAPKVYAPARRLDLSGLPSRGGDYARGELARRVDKPRITGDAILHYEKLCPGAPAVAFCVSIQHAEDVAAQFNAAGIPAAVIHGKMKRSEIKSRLDDLETGIIKVLVSVDLVSEGFDCPAVSAAILLRPTQSEALYIQQVGRALRPFPGKTEAVILDHSGNCFKHGMPDDVRDWSLQGRKKRRRGTDETAPPVRQCPKCFCCHVPRKVCPECGHVYEVDPRFIEQVDGTLSLMTPQQLKTEKKADIKAARTLEDFQAVASKWGYKPGWASIKYGIVTRMRGGRR